MGAIKNGYLPGGVRLAGTRFTPCPKTVQAALDIRDFIDQRAKQENVFQKRMGINSGLVVAGILGDKEDWLRHVGRHREQRGPYEK